MRAGVHSQQASNDFLREEFERIESEYERYLAADTLFHKAVGKAYLENVRDGIESFSPKFGSYDDIERGLSNASKQDVEELFSMYGTGKIVLPMVDEYITTFMETEDYQEAYYNALGDKVVERAVEEAEMSENLTLGIEYEIPTLNEVNRMNFEYDKLLYLCDEGAPLVSNEEIPRTVELQSEVHKGIISAVHEIDRRLELLENSEESPDIVYDPERYGRAFPGIHFHVGTELEGYELKAMAASVENETPILSFLTSNCPSDGFLSKRMVSNYAERMSFGKLEPVKDKLPGGNRTMEYRMPDIVREPEKMETFASIFVGVHGYYEELISKGEITEDLDMDYEKIAENLNDYLTGNKEVPESEMTGLMNRIERGLSNKGINPQNYMGRIEGLYQERKKAAEKLGS